MEIETIFAIVTFIVSLILGKITKKSTIPDELIPVQNIIVGLIVAIIEWIITKDFSTAIMLSGLLAGGAYDAVHNLDKILKGN